MISVFYLSFQHAATGFPNGDVFEPKTFIRPQRITHTGLSLLVIAAASSPFNKKVSDNISNSIGYNVE